jgi:hypothetical protein
MPRTGDRLAVTSGRTRRLVTGHWFLVMLLGCAATTSRPYFQPVPTAAVAEIELGIPQATRALAEGLAKDSIALSIIKENDGFIDSGWLDARTLEHTGARPLGAGVVRIRAWVNPAKQFWSELSVEATFRPIDDPSRPERELDVPLPEDHPLQKRLGAVIEKLIVQYGDADALRDFQQKTATAKADTLKVKPDTGKAKADTTKVKPDTAVTSTDYRPFPPVLASAGVNTSTARVKVRASAGCKAPTPTTWRVTSSPRSFLIEINTEYSQDSPTAGWRIVPCTLSAVRLGTSRSGTIDPEALERR